MASSAAATRGASDDQIDKASADIVEELKLENKTGNLQVFETLMYIKRGESPPSRLLSYLTRAHQRILDAAASRATPKKEEENTKQKWKKVPKKEEAAAVRQPKKEEEAAAVRQRKKEEDWHIVTPRNEGEGSAPGPVTRLSGEVEGSAPGPVTRLWGAQHDKPFFNPPTREVGVNVTPLDALATRTRFGYPIYTFPPTILSGDPPGDNPHKTRLSDRQWRQLNRLATQPLQPRAPRQSAASSSAGAASSANLNSIQDAAAASSCANLNKHQDTDNFTRFQ